MHFAGLKKILPQHIKINQVVPQAAELYPVKMFSVALLPHSATPQLYSWPTPITAIGRTTLYWPARKQNRAAELKEQLTFSFKKQRICVPCPAANFQDYIKFAWSHPTTVKEDRTHGT